MKKDILKVGLTYIFLVSLLVLVVPFSAVKFFGIKDVEEQKVKIDKVNCPKYISIERVSLNKKEKILFFL